VMIDDLAAGTYAALSLYVFSILEHMVTGVFKEIT